ncbi:M1 family metallopeptidase [Nocardioides sp.]|uniref:M1 family metallopeptidase n=1 Tax=Nocardioides sp. TaxID=35761 RepID=UPI001A322053|nr:M1 family metallopeptidase [Nocardioides sp.]MBJ7358542.1 M1 family metallopeptidase [Nocardioides sp.]
MRRSGAVALALATLLLGGCSATLTGAKGEPVTSGPPPTSDATPEVADPGLSGSVDDPAYDIALSEPVEDSYYPDVGDPGVDALHYDLSLAWTPRTRTLEGVTTLIFRATGDAESFQLDLGPALEVSAVTVDGAEVPAEHDGDDLVVAAPVVADERYAVEVHYAGTPEPVQAPTTRTDFSTLGFTITPSGEAWTMQEPYGAHTWYPVNDHPSDKALYDFTLSVPSPWTGVANGELTSRTEEAATTTTQWHLAEPAASYLTTVAFGDYTSTTNTSASGVEISYWVPSGSPQLADGLERAAAGLDWLEERLGPYPFDTLGFLLVDSQSGMETQTMVTLGITDYTMSERVLVHEMAHHWYGDQVTPEDWRDVWMNEGMTMYLQGMWQAERAGISVDEQMDSWAATEETSRTESGPPAAYDPGAFGENNIYYGPALMWHELRERIGDDAFLRVMREWPAARDNRSTDRDDYWAWLEEETGEELTAFLDAWLLGETTPPRD